MILEKIVIENEYEFVSKLGKKFLKSRKKTVFKIKCDVCDRILTRDKGEAYKIETREKHACSPECLGKIGEDSNKKRLLNYIPRLARRKTGYIHLGNERQHRVVAKKMLRKRFS